MDQNNGKRHIHHQMQVCIPHEATNTASLHYVEDCLKSQRKIYSLPRAENEAHVNDYYPILLLLCKANIDIGELMSQKQAVSKETRDQRMQGQLM